MNNNDNEAANRFNQFSEELRGKIDNLLKQVLLIGAGIQTITIGAFLSGKAPKLPTEAITLLQNGWLALSISIVCVLIFMFFQIIGLVQVGRLHIEKLESGNSGFEIIKGWKPLRYLNVLIGLSALGFCIGGVYLISQSAMLLISNTGT
ncbi:hypothetical protein [Moritella viscosa]|uniref:Diguanylate cyclase/phosphodiesterase n=1 Tax=Moritella viscosa TaxID=80854 RepID=A0A1L0B917_9GAMM|nr:hypothetical protein [Moritella viscosa]SGY93552.1 Diguanylate cyclase/phosphodiesterase [Moritella viscosa]